MVDSRWKTLLKALRLKRSIPEPPRLEQLMKIKVSSQELKKALAEKTREKFIDRVFNLINADIDLINTDKSKYTLIEEYTRRTNKDLSRIFKGIKEISLFNPLTLSNPEIISSYLNEHKEVAQEVNRVINEMNLLKIKDLDLKLFLFSTSLCSFCLWTASLYLFFSLVFEVPQHQVMWTENCPAMMSVRHISPHEWGIFYLMYVLQGYRTSV